MSQAVIDMSQYRPAAAPAQNREVRAEEADIGQSAASAAASAANAERSRATLPADTRRAEADADTASTAAVTAQINLAEAQATLERQQRTRPFQQAMAEDEFGRLYSALSNARQSIRTGMATGPIGQFSRNIASTPAADLQALFAQIRSPIVRDAMERARSSSSSGASGFGQLTVKEMELLASSIAALDPNMSAELQLQSLQQIEDHFRRAVAYNMGVDPRTEAGARYAGLAYNPERDPLVNPAAASRAEAAEMAGIRAAALGNDGLTAVGVPITEIEGFLTPPSYVLPQGEEASEPPRTDGNIEEGRWTSNPNLRGVDAAVTGLIVRGVANGLSDGDIEAEVHGYLSSVSPVFRDAIEQGGGGFHNLLPNIRYHRETGEDPRVLLERSYEQGTNTERPFIDSPTGAAMLGAADVTTGGFFDELTGSGTVRDAIAEDNPASYMTGQLAGGLATGSLTGFAGRQLGMRAPWMLSGAAENAVYGAGTAGEDRRLAGGLIGLATTPVGNAAGQAITRPLGTAISGTMDRGAQALAQRYGVEMTPGSVTPGGTMEWLERRLSELPVTNGAINNRRDESLLSFNDATFNRALEPIGGSTNGLIGREGVGVANSQVDDAYTAALSGVNITVDPARVFDDTWLNGVAGPAADSARRQIAVMRNNLVDPNGVMTGPQIQSAKQSMQELRTMLSNDPSIERSLVNRVDNMQDELYDAFETQAPRDFAMFREADQAYGNMQTVQNAVNMAPVNPDVAVLTDAQRGRVIRPSGLNVQARQGDVRYRGRRAAAEGEGTFSELADYGERLVRPSDAANLGGSIRTGLTLGLPAAGYAVGTAMSGAGGGEQGENYEEAGNGGVPAAAAYGTLLAAAMAAPFSRAGSRGYQRLMTADRPEAMRTIGDLMTRYGTRVAGAAAAKPMISDFAAPAYESGPVAFEPSELSSMLERYNERSAPASADGGGALTVGNRRVRYDPQTDDYVDLDTGERAPDVSAFMPAYRRGGRVVGR